MHTNWFLILTGLTIFKKKKTSSKKRKNIKHLPDATTTAEGGKKC